MIDSKERSKFGWEAKHGRFRGSERQACEINNNVQTPQRIPKYLEVELLREAGIHVNVMLCTLFSNIYF